MTASMVRVAPGALRCDNHPFDPAWDLCQHCLTEFCQDCVVYSFGPAELPLCMRCAIAASGVRARATRRRVTRAQRREAQQRSALLRELRAA